MNRYLLTLILGLLLVMVTTGCGTSGSGGTGGDSGGLIGFTTPQSYAMVVGTVKDLDGNALDGVEVLVSGVTSATNNQGYFALPRIAEANTATVSFKKPGYVLQSRTVHPRIGESSFINVQLAKKSADQLFNAGAGVEAANGGAIISIPPNSLMLANGTPYAGDAKISVTAFDPTTSKGHSAFPGRFEGVQADGSVIPFRSLGFIDVTPVTNTGAELQLKNGATADVTIPIGAGTLANAPATIPLWFFNPQDGRWHEEGIATRNGNVYHGKIKHFSIWNCDVGLRRAFVIGRVINCTEDGKPVKGARVTIQNQLAGWSSGEDSTPEDGTFRIPVNADEPVNLWAEKGGQKSRPLNFTAPARDQTHNVGDICLGVPKVQIVLSWGDKPLDLDAHLTIPLGNSRKHIFFGHKSESGAQLDTDDTSAYGPEMITVFKLNDGIYRYSIHHFTGDGQISTSRAFVHMTIDGLGIFEMHAPGTSKGVGDVWSLWDIRVNAGHVINLTALNTLENNRRADDSSAFSPR